MSKNSDGKWTIQIVTGRLTLNKEKDTLMVAYKDASGKEKRIPFNSKYVVPNSGFDLTELNTEEEFTIATQIAKEKARYETQINALNDLITQVESKINEEKANEEAIQNEIETLEARIVEIRKTVDALYNDKSSVDNRTKDGFKKSVRKLIDVLTKEAEEVEALLNTVRSQQTLLNNRLNSLEQQRDMFYNFYDEILETETAIDVKLADQAAMQTRIDNLKEVENRNTEEKLQNLLNDTQAEIELVNNRIGFIEKYLGEIRDILAKLNITDRFLNLFKGPSSVRNVREKLRNTIKSLEDLISSEEDIDKVQNYSDQLKEARVLLYMLAKENPDSTSNFKEIEQVKKELNKFSSELTGLQNSLKQLREKETRLIDALSIKKEITGTTSRLNAIKDLYKEFVTYFETNSVKDGKFGTATKVKEPNTSYRGYPEVTDTNETTVANDGTSAKPILSQTGLFKIADKHFLDNPDGTETIVPEAHTQRFYKFTSTVNTSGDYYFQVVTQANDKFGIRYVNENTGYPADADVKVIVVKKVGNEYKPVDVNGEVLSEANKDNIVYTSLIAAPAVLRGTDNEKLEWAKATFTTTGLTDAEILKHINEYNSFRTTLIKNVTEADTVFLKINTKNNGIEIKEPRVEGLFPQLSLEGRVVNDSITDDEWKDVDLRVTTAGNNKEGNTTKINGVTMALGRLVVVDNKTDAVYKVYNRKFSDAEVNTIAKAIVRFEKLLGRSAQLEGEELVEFNRLKEYLSSVLFWESPKEGETISNKQIWISNGLHIGSDIFIPNVSITEQVVKGALKDMYHQVNNNNLSAKNKNNSFYEPNFTDDGKVTWNEWSSYKKYLMDSNGRKAPLYTNVVKKSNDIDKPQFKNVYLTYYPPSGETVKANTVTVNPTPNGSNLSDIYDLAEPMIKYGDGQEDITFQGTDRTIAGLRDANYRFSFVMPDGVMYLFAFEKSGNSIKVIKKASIKEGKDISGDKTAQLNAIEKVLTDLKPQDDLADSFDTMYKNIKPSHMLMNEYVPKVTPAEAQVSNNLPVTNEGMIASDEQETTVKSTEENTQVLSNESLYAKMAALKASMSLTEEDDESVKYRLATNTVTVQEDIESFKNWMKQNLPQIPVEIVNKLIDNKAWGAFKEGAIHIFENSQEGTGFHEAFEAVWSSFLSENDKAELITEFRNRTGEFYNPFNNKTALHKDATEYDVREMLAEEFIGFVKADGKDISKGRPKRNSFFRKLWNFIKSLFGASDKIQDEFESKINNIFNKITKGEFKNSVPTSFVGTIYRAIPGTNQLLTSQIIEGMHSIFFRKLLENNENVESLLNKANNSEFTSKLFAQTKVALRNQLFTPILKGYEKVASNEIAKSYEKHLDTTAELYNDILSKYYSDIVPIYKDYLKRFNLGMVSDEDIEEKEESAKDPLGIKESIYIDSRNLASSSIRLLLASLGDLQYKSDSSNEMINKVNGLKLPILVDYGRILNILLNELEGIVPVYKNGKYSNRLDLMFEKLDAKYKTGNRYKDGFLWIAQLKNRLKYESFEGQRYNINSLNQSELKLLIAFEKSFSNNRNLPIKLIVNSEGVIYSTDPIVSSNINRIREEWLNNAKSQVNGASSLLTINNESQIIINTTKLKDLIESDKFEDKINMLKQLGITLSVNTQELSSKGSKYYSTFNEAVESIKYVISNNKVKTFDDLFGKQVANGPMNKLVEIEMNAKSEDVSLQYQNAAGRSEYSITLPSLISNVFNSLKGVETLEDFVLTNPQFGSVVNGEVYLNPYQANSFILQKGGMFFDKNGKKKNANITYQLFSGMANAMENDGYVTADLKFPDKIAQELFHIMNGTYFTIINSDKSSEFGLKMGHFVDFTSSLLKTDVATKYYLPHLRDEVVTAVNNTKNKSNIQYYKDGVEKLGHFRTIINQSKEKFDKVIDGTMSVNDFINSKEVLYDIEKYIDVFISKQRKMLFENGIFTPNSDGTFKTNYLSKELLKDYKINNESITNGQLDNLLRFIFINHQIAAREQHKLIYGHPALYKDLAKRSSGANSTKEAITSNTEVIAAMDKLMPRNDGKVRSVKEDQTFNVISFKDNIVVSEYAKDIAEGIYTSMLQSMPKEKAESLIGAKFDENGKLTEFSLNKGKHFGIIKTYLELNEADAQAWIMPDMYRDMLYLSGKWSDDQEKQWQYEIAYEKRAKKQSLTSEEKDLLKAGSPGVVMPTLKPQFFGYQVNDNMMHTTFLKHSVQPKFYRHVEGTAFAKVYEQAKDNQIDVIGFESGEKVGNIVEKNNDFVSMYDNGDINKTTPTIQELYTKYYGIQVEMAPKSKSQVIRGTQMTKLIISNLLNNGTPITESVVNQIEEYNNVLKSLMLQAKESLIEELGLVKTEDGIYNTENLSNLLKILRDEAIKRELPDNVIESLVVDETDPTKLKYKFDTLPIREKIDNILNSIVDSRVISQKMNGKSSVQVAASGYENSSRKFTYLKNGVYTTIDANKVNQLSPEEKASVKMTSSDLKFYKLENGKISRMEVLLPHYLKGALGEDIENIDPRLLQLIGFRIPTQALSQI